MDPKMMTQRMQKMWDGMAVNHTNFVQERWTTQLNEELMAAIKAHMNDQQPSLSGGLEVLDLAGGSGFPAFPLAKEFPDARITLTDLSPVMVGLVIDRIKARGLEGRITAQQADAQDLSGFQDASFDVVTCQFGLFLMPEHVKALREAARVLRPGGLVAVTVFGGEQQMSKLMQETAKRLHIDSPAAKIQFNQFADVSRTTADFEVAGFGAVTAKPFDHKQVYTREDRTTILLPWLMGVLGAGRDEEGNVTKEASQAALAAMKELGFLSADGETCTITNQALLYTGVTLP